MPEFDQVMVLGFKAIVSRPFWDFGNVGLND